MRVLPRRRQAGARGLHAHHLANRILFCLTEHCELPARIGIGGRRAGWEGLRQSYHEACGALLRSNETIAEYRKGDAPLTELFVLAQEVAQLLAGVRLAEARQRAASLSALVTERYGARAMLSTGKLFLCSALDSLSVAARGLGCPQEALAAAHHRGVTELDGSATVLDIHEAWLRAVDAVIEQVRLLYAGKQQKVAERIKQLVQEYFRNRSLPRTFSIPAIAASLGISAGRLSRIFKQQTGETLEGFLMRSRTELAKRLLLDPVSSIAEVARQCGYSDPAYFSRVFRKLQGCSPREFRRNPHAFTQSAAAGPAASQ